MKKKFYHVECQIALNVNLNQAGNAKHAIRDLRSIFLDVLSYQKQQNVMSPKTLSCYFKLLKTMKTP